MRMARKFLEPNHVESSPLNWNDAKVDLLDATQPGSICWVSYLPVFEQYSTLLSMID